MISDRIRIAHLGFYNAAPLLTAVDSGCFDEEAVGVEAVRELGMATITARLSEGAISGAIVPAQVPLLLSLGIGRSRIAMRILGITSYQDMAIVISTRRPLEERMPHKPQTQPALKLGVIAADTPGKLLIAQWWRTAGVGGEREPVCLSVAASQLLDFMRDGVIDGFCGPDPLGLLAQIDGIGRVAARSADLYPFHPGSVLAVREDFALREPRSCEALARALSKAKALCADPARQPGLLEPILTDLCLPEMGSDGRVALTALRKHEDFSAPGTAFARPANRRDLDAVGIEFIAEAARSVVGFGGRNRDLSPEIARLFEAGCPA